MDGPTTINHFFDTKLLILLQVLSDEEHLSFVISQWIYLYLFTVII